MTAPHVVLFTDLTMVVWCGVASLLGGVAMGATGFGPAILFRSALVVTLMVVHGTADNVLVMVLITLPTCLTLFVMCIATVKAVNWPILAMLAVPALFMIPVGTLLLMALNPKPIGQAVGITVILLAVFRIWKEVEGAFAPPKPVKLKGAIVSDGPSRASHEAGPDTALILRDKAGLKLHSLRVLLGRCRCACLGTRPETCRWPSHRVMVGTLCVGLCIGFSQGLIGIPGLPLMVYMTTIKLRKTELRATVTALLTIVIPLQAAYLAFKAPEFFAFEYVPTYVASSAGCLLGVAFGVTLHQRMTSLAIRRTVLGLLVISAASLGGGGHPAFIAAALGIQIAFFGGAVAFRKWQARRRDWGPLHEEQASATLDSAFEPPPLRQSAETGAKDPPMVSSPVAAQV